MYNKNMYANDITNNKKYLTHSFKLIPINLKDIYIQAYSNMRLDQLSIKYYGIPDYWYIIAQANNILADSFIYDNPGLIIRIPYIGV